MKLDWPPSCIGNKSGEVLAVNNYSLAAVLESVEVCEEVSRVVIYAGQEFLCHRCDKWVGVDLTVRVVQRHANLFSAVLEGEHLHYAIDLLKLRGSVHPCADDSSDSLHWHRTQAALVLGGEDHYLAAAK